MYLKLLDKSPNTPFKSLSLKFNIFKFVICFKFLLNASIPFLETLLS